MSARYIDPKHPAHSAFIVALNDAELLAWLKRRRAILARRARLILGSTLPEATAQPGQTP